MKVNSYTRFHKKIIMSKAKNGFTWLWLAKNVGVTYDALRKLMKTLENGTGGNGKVILKIAEVLNIKF